jgi:uncharacterized protein (UPF0335 family)
MESSRDSSFWRSLAVAFGDGLAFGVGMKLSQNAARNSARQVPAANRLEQIEERVERMERAPALSSAPPGKPGAGRAAAGSGSFDQKVLEAVVNALEARLKENSVEVERRLADLEAKIALELQTLHLQDQSIASGAQAWVDDTRLQFNEQVSAVRERVEKEVGALHGQVVSLNREFAEAVARIVDEQVGGTVKSQVDALGHALEQKLAGAVEQQVAQAVEARLGAVEEQMAATVEKRLAAAEQTVEARIDAAEQRVAAALRSEFEGLERDLRTQLDRKDREVAELRQRVAESDSAALDFVAGVGDLCRRTAERIAGPAALGPPIPPITAKSADPATVSEPPPPPPTAGLSAPAASGSEPGAEAIHDPPLPGFARPRQSRQWSFPIVSSLFVATAGMLLLHYL